MNIEAPARQVNLVENHPLGPGTLLNNPGKALYQRLNEDDGHRFVRRLIHGCLRGFNHRLAAQRFAIFMIPNPHSEGSESAADFPSRSCADIARG